MKLDSQKKPRKLNKYQQVIKRFVSVETGTVPTSFWMLQTKFARELIEKYSLEFLLWCPPPNNYKVNSLIWFITDSGKDYFTEQLFEYKKQNPSQIEVQKFELSQEKIGEDANIVSTPKTLKDFLNYGKTKK